ncbi:MAG: helix-turn-helix domain-containing protein [Myxococcota bacterium]|jgi:excisionase family DNA binding protein
MTTVQVERHVARLWKVGDVAEYLGVSKSWVYKAAESKELPVRRLGALLRFDPEAIQAYAAGLPGVARRVVVPLPTKFNARRPR